MNETRDLWQIHGCENRMTLAIFVFGDDYPCACGQRKDGTYRDHLILHGPSMGCDMVPCAMCTFEGEQGAAPKA
jgi:hypothetical protein